jgi:hypothetical protein
MNPGLHEKKRQRRPFDRQEERQTSGAEWYMELRILRRTRNECQAVPILFLPSYTENVASFFCLFKDVLDLFAAIISAIRT